MKVALFVAIKPPPRSLGMHPEGLDESKPDWRWEGWLEMSPEEWIATERPHLEADNGPGMYLMVPMPAPPLRDEEDDEIKTRVFAFVERESGKLDSYLWEYNNELDRDLAADCSDDVGTWLEEV